MRILAIGDLHLRAKKLKDVENAWYSAVKWAHANQVDIIVQAGDVFDHANVYGREASTGTIYGAFLAPFMEQAKPLPLFVIPGNHDIGSPKDKDALSPVDRYPWITVVRKPSLVQINEQLAICAVPWINRTHLISKLLSKGQQLEEATKQVNGVISRLMTPLGEQVRKEREQGKFILFVGHLEVSGAKLTGAVQHGGSFEFMPEALKSVGADAYALAHIHIRQYINGLPNPNDGYMGCLCQLNFGEQGNTVGCRLIETDGQKVILDKWLDNKSSPKYFTASSIEGLNYRPGIDYVKIRGLTKPETLPDGVIFERLPQNVQARAKLEEKLDCNLSLRALLAAWANVAGCTVDIDVLTTEAERLSSICQSPVEAIGSLERLSSMKIKNLTCHGHTELEFDTDGIIGFAGPNGTGKTTAIEGMMMALYGISPSKPTLQAMLPKGDVVDAAIEIAFMSGGKSYRVRREFGRNKKTFSHKAYVFEGPNNKPLANGVDGATSFNTGLVGDPDLVLAGVFSSQGDSGNLVRLKPAARKDLFAKLLGTEKFLGISEAAKKIYAADHAASHVLRARFEALKEELSSEDVDKHSLENSVVSSRNKKAEADGLRSRLDELASKMSGLENSKKDIDRSQALLKSMEEERQQIKTEGSILKQRLKELESFQADNVEGELQEAQKALVEANEIGDQISSMTKAALEAEREIGLVRELRDVELRAMAEKLQTGKSKLEKLQSRLEDSKRRADMLKGFPDLPECRQCPLAKDGIESRDGVANLEEDIQNVLSKLAACEEVMSKHRKETSVKIEDIKSRIQEVPASLIQRRASLQKIASQLGVLEAKQAKVQSRSAEIAKTTALMDAARERYTAINDQISNHVIPAFDAEAWSQACSAKTELMSKVQTADSEVASANIEVGKFRAKIEQHAARMVELKAISQDVLQKEGKAAIHEALAKAFGRDGIPQLIVDSAIPHLQDIMFDMMSEIDGKWSIRIATQRETKAGTTQERIDIIVDDGEEERDISTYSGGEMNLLSTIVRIAFSILQAERSGRGLKVLVLDECMYFADAEHSDAFMRMLKKLPRYFNQIFVISHSEYVLSSIPNKIFFARGSDGKTMVKKDFST